jgi:hypothetical protein
MKLELSTCATPTEQKSNVRGKTILHDVACMIDVSAGLSKASDDAYFLQVDTIQYIYTIFIFGFEVSISGAAVVWLAFQNHA